MVLQNVESVKSISIQIADKNQNASPQFGLAILHELSQSIQPIDSLVDFLPNSANGEKKVAIGSRPMSAGKREQWVESQHIRPKHAQAIHAAYPIEIIADDVRSHFLASYSVFDNTVELEDGSFWKVRSGDMFKVLDWALNDDLSIVPNYGIVSGRYSIINRETGQSVVADLVIGPEALGQNTHWIIGIDRWLGRVYLENGTYWDVRGIDQYLLSDWEINDTVILGDGANEWLGHHDSILINVNLDHYVYSNRGA